MLALAGDVGCGAKDAPPDLGSSSATVANGHEDTADEFSFVVHLTAAGRQCSGVLVSPGVVVTARHCIVGANMNCFEPSQAAGYDLSGSEWTIQLGAAWTAPSKTISYTGKNGPIALGKGGSHALVDSCSKNDSSTDIALMPLDERVPLGIAKPMHLPLNGFPSCNTGDDFDGTLIGFGKTAGPPFASGETSFRTYHDVSAWSRENSRPRCETTTMWPPVDLDGAVYANYWGLNYVVNYDGVAPGDSGGALVTSTSFLEAMPGHASPLGNPEGRLLCGINSRYYPVTPCDTLYPGALAGNDTAAVDSPDNLGTAAAAVMGTDGNFKGECFAGSIPQLQDQDSDGDLIPDACDPCPHYWDANYDTSTTPDADGDGVPDRCDNCPTTFNKLLPREAADGTFVIDQLDSDHDGYGDFCDSCDHTDRIEAPAGKYLTDYQCCQTAADCGVVPSCYTSATPDSPPDIPTSVCFPGDSRGTLLDDLKAKGIDVQPCSAPDFAPPRHQLWTRSRIPRRFGSPGSTS